ncbi:MAG: alpha/beta fold hydrolase [Phormidesmis sp.]
MWLVVAVLAVYHAIASWRENQQTPPGQFIDIDGDRLHLWHVRSPHPEASLRPKIIIEHSLGGVEGYLLVQKMAELADVCICDRAGYGWSDISKKVMTSEERMRSLNLALSQANIQPPYILVGNSLGSYHMRLFAHTFPEKVVGLVLTDGLHEKALLKMPRSLRCLQALFFAGFIMSIAGSALGFVRLAGMSGLFSLLKPELKSFSKAERQPVLRSFYRPKHWFTMAREICQIDTCGQQLKVANDLGCLPVVNVKARYFFKPTGWMRCLPLATVEQLRDAMHRDLMTLSSRCVQLKAAQSSHFVWTDQPKLIFDAVQMILADSAR